MPPLLSNRSSNRSGKRRIRYLRDNGEKVVLQLVSQRLVLVLEETTCFRRDSGLCWCRTMMVRHPVPRAVVMKRSETSNHRKSCHDIILRTGPSGAKTYLRARFFLLHSGCSDFCVTGKKETTSTLSLQKMYTPRTRLPHIHTTHFSNRLPQTDFFNKQPPGFQIDLQTDPCPHRSSNRSLSSKNYSKSHNCYVHVLLVRVM